MRKSFADDVRIALLEEDADHHEADLKAAVRDVSESLDGMRKTQRYLIGVGVSILLSIIVALAGIAFK